MTTQPCPACERGTLVPRPAKPALPFRHVRKLVATREVAIPTCDQCGEQVINRVVALEIDAALEETLSHNRDQIVESGLERMAEAGTQREWERRLGLSAGYLSRLKAGKESSVALVTLIGLIGQAPDLTANRIEEIWTTGGALPRRTVLSSTKWTAQLSPGRANPPVGRAKVTTTIRTPFEPIPEAA